MTETGGEREEGGIVRMSGREEGGARYFAVRKVVGPEWGNGLEKNNGVGEA